MAKQMIVEDRYRKNSLSLKPGGSVVTIEYTDGSKVSYDKVKNPTAYINLITKGKSITQILVDGEVWKL